MKNSKLPCLTTCANIPIDGSKIWNCFEFETAGVHCAHTNTLRIHLSLSEGKHRITASAVANLIVVCLWPHLHLVHNNSRVGHFQTNNAVAEENSESFTKLVDKTVHNCFSFGSSSCYLGLPHKVISDKNYLKR